MFWNFTEERAFQKFLIMGWDTYEGNDTKVAEVSYFYKELI